MAIGHDVVVVGAGIMGLASAYHILQADRGLDLLVLERLPGAGQATTARSAAAFRDLFTVPVNRHLAQGGISFYEQVQTGGEQLDLLKLGYLWLLTLPRLAQYSPAFQTMAAAGVVFDILSPEELRRRLPALQSGGIAAGIMGRRCGVLNPHRLSGFYAREVTRLGGRFRFGVEVTGFVQDEQGLIQGVKIGGEDIRARQVIVATGPWLAATMALASLKAPVVPVKRQIFVLEARKGPLRQLFETPGFNQHGFLPFTILPEEAYLRPTPAAHVFITGFANPDEPPGIEVNPAAAPEFFEQRIRPQLEQYFPVFRGVQASHSWAGHYENHPPDNIAFADRLGGAIVVGGGSGSGIMKADSLGRAAAGLFFGREQVELGDGKPLTVAEVGLEGRILPAEEFVI